MIVHILFWATVDAAWIVIKDREDIAEALRSEIKNILMSKTSDTGGVDRGQRSRSGQK